MRRNLLTEMFAQITVIMIPHSSTVAPVMAISRHVTMVRISGSYQYNAYMPKPKTTHASTAATIPIKTALKTNGLRMNPQEAPTSFMVWMEKRRA